MTIMDKTVLAAVYQKYFSATLDSWERTDVPLGGMLSDGRESNSDDCDEDEGVSK